MSNASRNKKANLGSIFYVYEILNEETGQFYIGSTNNVPDRCSSHFRQLERNIHANERLQKAYNENPKFSLSIISDHPTHALAYEEEQERIALQWNNNNLLNNSVYGAHRISSVTRQKLSLAGKRSFDLNPARKQFLSALTKKRMKDPDFRKYLSELGLERVSNPSFKENLSALQRERMKSEELRKHLSNKTTIQMQAPEAREAARQGAKRQWLNPEFRIKRCRKISIDGVYYDSIVEASAKLGVNKVTIRQRCLSKYNDNYKFLTS